jgi:hypothetical protein
MSEKIFSATKAPAAKSDAPASAGRRDSFSGKICTPQEQVISLQQTVGNQAVQRHVASGRIQAKLKISAPNDEYEQEADSVAERILLIPESMIQRKPICAAGSMCEEEILVKKRLADQITPQLHPKAAKQSVEVPCNVHSHVEALKGGGEPLSVATRSYFEPRFGQDFSNVRVHKDANVAEISKSMQARAFTYGKNIGFGAGEYAPESGAGRKLLAHELTHVVQQGRCSASTHDVQRVEGGQWKDEHELAKREAATAAASARIEGDTEYWRGYALSPDEQTIEIVLKAVIAEKGFKGAANFLMDYKFRIGWSTEQAALRKRIIPTLEKKLKDLEECGKEYIQNTFGPQATNHLKIVLADSKKVIDALAEKFGLSEKTTHASYSIYGGSMTTSSTTYSLTENNDTRDMANAAREIINKNDKITELNKKRESFEEKTYGCTENEESGMRLRCNKWGVVSLQIKDPVAHKQACADIEKAQQEYMILRVQREKQYPILASFRPPEGLNQLKVIAEGTKGARDMVIGMEIAQKRKNIEEISSVADDDKFIWKQGSIISGAKKELGVQPGSVEDRAVDVKVLEVADSENLKNLTFGFISIIGALLAAIPSGGSSLVAWGAGTAGAGLLVGASGFNIYEGIRDYQIQKAAAGTAFDKAQAISQKDPSLFWLAFQIVMSVADVAMAAGFFAKAAKAIRAVGQAELEEMARSAYRNSGLNGVMSEEEFVQKYRANMKARVESPKTEASADTAKTPAEAPGVPKVAKLPKPGTILARGVSEEAVKDAYFQAARQSAPEGVEVGIFRRRLPDGSEEYAVVQGRKGAVSPPGDEWIGVSHFHPGAEGQPGFQNPAPQDLSVSAQESVSVHRPPGEKGLFTQKVHSQGPDGRIIEVEYGVDPKNYQYFVKRPGQPPKYFEGGTYPDSINPQVNRADLIVDPDKRMQELIKIFKTLDPDKYYAGWYARQF